MKLLPSKKNLRKKNLVKEKPDFANLKTASNQKTLNTIFEPRNLISAKNY